MLNVFDDSIITHICSNSCNQLSESQLMMHTLKQSQIQPTGPTACGTHLPDSIVLITLKFELRYIRSDECRGCHPHIALAPSPKETI